MAEQQRPLTSATQLTASDGGSSAFPSLKGLANGSAILSIEYDNSTNLTRYQFLNAELLVRGASSFVAGQQIDCWVLTALDGTNYEDGAASGPVVPGRAPDFTFYPRAANTQQRIQSPLIPIPPSKFKVLVRNTTITSGVAFTNTNSENILYIYMN